MRKPHLQALIFETTQRCNHACLHCYNIWRPGTEGEAPSYPPGQLDTAETLSLLRKALEEVHPRNVTLTGGEPLLREDLPQILTLLREFEVLPTIISNGRLLTPPTIVDLLDRGVGLFELPLLSHRRQVHDQLSGVPGAFDAVLAAMAHLRSLRGQFVAVFVATRRNLPDLLNTVQLAYAFGARGLMLNRFNPGGRGRRQLKELLPTAEEMRNALHIADAAAAKYQFPISCSIPIQPCIINTSSFAHLRFGYCAAGTDNAYYTLDPLGNLRPCNHTTTVLGNLLDKPFSELTAPERMASFTAATPDFCAPCKMRQSCQGGCKAAAQVCYGSLSAEEPFLHLNRNRAKPILK